MKTKIFLLTGFLLLGLSYSAYAQTWTNVSPPWAATNRFADVRAMYGGNLYAGTFNSGGAQVWQYNGTTWL